MRALKVRRARRVEHPSSDLHAGSPASITRNVYGPSFRFRLERVRSLRKHGERLAQQELAGALGRRDDCEAELMAADERAGAAHRARRDAAGRVQTAIDLLSHQAWIERTAQAREAMAEDLAAREREVSRRRIALTVAARDHKALERLEVKRRNEFDRNAARIEGRLLDEMATNRFDGTAA
jgi:flagellar export protein FliJ